MQRGFWCQTLRFEPQTVVVHLCIPRLWIRTRCSNSHRHQALVIIGQFFRDEEKYLGCVLWMKSSWVSVTVCVAELDSGGSPSTAVTVDRREPRPTSEGNPTYWHPTIWTWSKIRKGRILFITLVVFYWSELRVISLNLKTATIQQWLIQSLSIRLLVPHLTPRSNLVSNESRKYRISLRSEVITSPD